MVSVRGPDPSLWLLQYFSTRGGIGRSVTCSNVPFLRSLSRLLKQRDGLVLVHLAQVHVPLCRGEMSVPGKLLDGQNRHAR